MNRGIISKLFFTVCFILSTGTSIGLCLNAPNSFASNLYFDVWVLCLISWVFVIIG